MLTKNTVWLGVFMLQNVEIALAGQLGQMSLVNDYQTFDPICSLHQSSPLMKKECRMGRNVW